MSWVTTEICWYFHYSCCSKHLTSHACALLIDNVGNYLYMYLNNGSFKSEVDPHQFNLRERKKIFKSWQVCDWLAKWLIVLGFMDLRWPRVYRRSNVGLVIICGPWLHHVSHKLHISFSKLIHRGRVTHKCISRLTIIITPVQPSWRGYTGITLSVCGQNRIHSVASTIHAGSISYVHTLSKNFRRCVIYKYLTKWQNLKFWQILKTFVSLTLSCFDFGSNMNCSIVWAWDPIWTAQ